MANCMFDRVVKGELPVASQEAEQEGLQLLHRTANRFQQPSEKDPVEHLLPAKEQI